MYFSCPEDFDRAGRQISPQRVFFLEMSAVTGRVCCCAEISPWKIVESYVVIAIAALYMLGIGNLSSVHYPRAMNPERVSQNWRSQLAGANLPSLSAGAADIPGVWRRVVFSSETIFLTCWHCGACWAGDLPDRDGVGGGGGTQAGADSGGAAAEGR